MYHYVLKNNKSKPDHHVCTFAQGALFRLQLALAEEAARKVALGTAPHSGQQLLTAEQVCVRVGVGVRLHS